MVPDASPENGEPLTLVPDTVISKSDATAIPPSLLITRLMTVRVGPTSSLIIVQRSESSSEMVPVQSPENVAE